MTQSHREQLLQVPFHGIPWYTIEEWPLNHERGENQREKVRCPGIPSNFCNLSSTLVIYAWETVAERRLRDRIQLCPVLGEGNTRLFQNLTGTYWVPVWESVPPTHPASWRPCHSCMILLDSPILTSLALQQVCLASPGSVSQLTDSLSPLLCVQTALWVSASLFILANFKKRFP